MILVRPPVLIYSTDPGKASHPGQRHDDPSARQVHCNPESQHDRRYDCPRLQHHSGSATDAGPADHDYRLSTAQTIPTKSLIPTASLR